VVSGDESQRGILHQRSGSQENWVFTGYSKNIMVGLICVNESTLTVCLVDMGVRVRDSEGCHGRFLLNLSMGTWQDAPLGCCLFRTPHSTNRDGQ